METIDVFFYKLSRKFIAFWDLFKTYFNDSTRNEKILFIALAVIVLLFLLVVLKIMQRSYFNRRVKKLGFVNVVHINTVNEVYEKNIFIRLFLFFWNFNKLVIVEAKPLALLDAIFPEPAPESTDEVVEDIKEIEELVNDIPDIPMEEETEEILEEEFPQVDTTPSVLPIEVEALVEKRFAELAKRLEETLMVTLGKIPTEKTAVEEIKDSPIEEPIESPKEVVEAFKEVTEHIEEAKEEQKETAIEKPKETEEPDPFFDKEVHKKYIVCKHPISGWQIKKEGSKRASRLFNTKKQAIAHATKSKFDFTIE